MPNSEVRFHLSLTFDLIDSPLADSSMPRAILDNRQP
jgi:hypothetical protein